MQKVTVTVWICVIVAACWVPESYGHSGGHDAATLRSWHFNDGTSLRGSLHSFRQQCVVIEDKSGRLHGYPLARLRSVDRQYAEERLLAIATLHAASTQTHHARDHDIGSTVAQRNAEWPAITAAVILLGAAVGGSLAVFRRRPLMFRIAGAFVVATCIAVTAQQSDALFTRMLLATDPSYVDATFDLFKPHVKTRWDDVYFYVECNGMPTEMPAMKGITAWQQQVPIPQPYTGNNAWSIPLKPEIASVSVSLDTALHTGAVAIGVNGVPVFNPENNRGEFSYDIGELDAFGGHCGRADDYHYHVAPVHLQKVVGTTKPIAWALDGYPMYGYEEPDGSQVNDLDNHLGHIWQGEYHYHATKTRPYMIASMRGKVTVQNDQIMPQPRASSIRPFLQALRGATITDLRMCDSTHYALRYSLNGKTHWVNYRWDNAGKFTYVFLKPDTARRTVTYQRK